MPEAILIAQIGDRGIASSQGVMLTFQHRLPDVIARAVSAADRIAKRGSVVEVIVENGRDRYTVWNSAVDSYVSGGTVPSDSSTPESRQHQSK